MTPSLYDPRCWSLGEWIAAGVFALTLVVLAAAILVSC